MAYILVIIINVLVAMRTIRLLAAVAVVLFALPLASVFANGYSISVPILGTTGAPALASPSLFGGVITVLYADGAPVVLSTNQVTFNVCESSCVLVKAKLQQTAPGTYAYSFTPPTNLSGTVTIFIQAGTLADDNGRIFPSVDTQIGTYAALSASSVQSTAPTPSAPTSQVPSGTPVSPESKVPTRQAVTPSQVKQESPIVQVVLTLTVLALVAVGLLILPTRRK